ncbi:MAG: hypothetical protein E7558_08965 [Ruminococcaceae bacterium]|nr:hypothetical protein [Oscillospiraceae bacterium]
MSALLEQKCPCCGGAIEFNAGTQNMKCPYCDAEFDVAAMEQAADASANIGQDNFDWQTEASQWQSDEISGMGVYICKSCGGEIVADATTGATTCPYCDNPVVMTSQFAGGLKPNLIIPFKYDKKQAKEALNKYIASKKMVPKIFKDQNHIDEIKGVYVPHWLFTGTAVATADFTAERVRHWSDSDNNYTETSYFNCYRSGNMNFANIPVDGSSKMDDALMESIEPFNISEAKPFSTAYMAGYLADKYDVDLDSSIPRANERVKNSVVSALERNVMSAGYSVVIPQNSQIEIANGSYAYALYPVWILNTTWNGKKYTFAMNGQTGKFVGDLPLDKSAFWKKVAMLTPIMSAIAYGVLWALGNM